MNYARLIDRVAGGLCPSGSIGRPLSVSASRNRPEYGCCAIRHGGLAQDTCEYSIQPIALRAGIFTPPLNKAGVSALDRGAANFQDLGLICAMLGRNCPRNGILARRDVCTAARPSGPACRVQPWPQTPPGALASGNLMGGRGNRAIRTRLDTPSAPAAAPMMPINIQFTSTGTTGAPRAPTAEPPRKTL